jgi:hypothetical protein
MNERAASLWRRIKRWVREDRAAHREAQRRHRELDARLNTAGLKRPIGPSS